MKLDFTEKDVEFIEDVLIHAGKILINYFSKEIHEKEKTGANDLVTIADIESDEYIYEKLKQKYPGVEVCSEERPYDKSKGDYRFILDPLEGTSNFALNIPLFVIMIALVDKNGCLFSMIYNPLLNTTFYALKNKGAFKDGEKIRVNKNSDIGRSSISTNYSYTTPVEKAILIDKKIREMGIKRKLDDWCGGYDFCLLAEGKIEAVFSDDPAEHDIIPGSFIAKEAGALITNWKGEGMHYPYEGNTIASNGLDVHSELVKILSGA